MPPILALLLCAALVVWLFRRDARQQADVTSALWIPFLWIFISGSRFLSGWLDVFGLPSMGGSPQEGSPLDALLFLILIVGGIRVLRGRQVNWSEFARQNQWLAIYLGYCLVAVLWSDFPFVSAKRWVKLFGQPVMALVVLTEPNPMEAVTRLFKRFAYAIVPVSVLFVKYYPQWGSCYDQWTGQRMNTGITTDKNALGCDAFIIALFLVWHLTRVWRWEKSPARRSELLLCFGLLVPNMWLLYMAHSSSPIGALAMALIMFFFLGLRWVDFRKLGFYVVVAVIAVLVGVYFFKIHELVIKALGRQTNLTGRTEIWDILWHWGTNPLLGVGFESFWLGSRLDRLAEMLPGLSLNEAHNGYLETYIQIGGIGVGLTFCMLLATFKKTQRELFENYDFGRFRLAYLAAFVIYNFTEALFRTHAFPFFVFFLIAIDYARVQLVDRGEDVSLDADSKA